MGPQCCVEFCVAGLKSTAGSTSRTCVRADARLNLPLWKCCKGFDEGLEKKSIV